MRDAALLYEAALPLHPRPARLHVQSGHMRKEAGDLAAAEAHYRAAEAGLPGDADLALQLGHLYKIWGRRDDAERSYTRALTLKPGWTVAQAELAGLGEQAGRRHLAHMTEVPSATFAANLLADLAVPPAEAQADGSPDFETQKAQIAHARTIGRLLPQLAPRRPFEMLVSYEEMIELKRLGREEAGYWGLQRTLRGLEAIRGFAISTSPVLSVQVRLNGLTLYEGAPKGGYALDHDRYPGAMRKYVFNIWLDFSTYPFGLHEIEVAHGARGRCPPDLYRGYRDRRGGAGGGLSAIGRAADARSRIGPLARGTGARTAEHGAHRRARAVSGRAAQRAGAAHRSAGRYDRLDPGPDTAARAGARGAHRGAADRRQRRAGALARSVRRDNRHRLSGRQDRAPPIDAARRAGEPARAAGAVRLRYRARSRAVRSVARAAGAIRRALHLGRRRAQRGGLAVVDQRFRVQHARSLERARYRAAFRQGARDGRGAGRGARKPCADHPPARSDACDARTLRPRRRRALCRAAHGRARGIQPLALLSRAGGDAARTERPQDRDDDRGSRRPRDDPGRSARIRSGDLPRPAAAVRPFRRVHLVRECDGGQTIRGRSIWPRCAARTSSRSSPRGSTGAEWGQETTGSIISRKVPCQGCLVFHNIEECGKDFACVVDIRPEEVFAAMQPHFAHGGEGQEAIVGQAGA